MGMDIVFKSRIWSDQDNGEKQWRLPVPFWRQDAGCADVISALDSRAIHWSITPKSITHSDFSPEFQPMVHLLYWTAPCGRLQTSPAISSTSLVLVVKTLHFKAQAQVQPLVSRSHTVRGTAKRKPNSSFPLTIPKMELTPPVSETCSFSTALTLCIGERHAQPRNQEPSWTASLFHVSCLISVRVLWFQSTPWKSLTKSVWKTFPSDMQVRLCCNNIMNWLSTPWQCANFSVPKSTYLGVCLQKLWNKISCYASDDFLSFT